MTPNTDIAIRAFVSLKAPCSGKSSAEVSEISGLSIRQVNRIYAHAINRGFNPNVRPLILKDEYLKDKPRLGQPTKAMEETKELVISKLRDAGVEISVISIYQMLVSSGFKKTKLTRKPGLMKSMKAERLA